MSDTKKKLVHALFNCRSCNRTWDNYMTAQKEARNHAKKSKHYVTGEVAYFVSYGEETKSSKGNKHA